MTSRVARWKIGQKDQPKTFKCTWNHYKLVTIDIAFNRLFSLCERYFTVALSEIERALLDIPRKRKIIHTNISLKDQLCSDNTEIHRRNPYDYHGVLAIENCSNNATQDHLLCTQCLFSF